MSRVVRDAVWAARKAPLLSILSITTIAFSLFAFALFGLVALNIKKALDEVQKLTDTEIKKMEEMGAAKEKELMTV